jgi:hypothetical protein
MGERYVREAGLGLGLGLAIFVRGVFGAFRPGATLVFGRPLLAARRWLETLGSRHRANFNVF